MNDTQRQTLLKVARDTVEAVITRKRLPKVETDDPELNAHCGCFVTLKNQRVNFAAASANLSPTSRSLS